MDNFSDSRRFFESNVSQIRWIFGGSKRLYMDTENGSEKNETITFYATVDHFTSGIHTCKNRKILRFFCLDTKYLGFLLRNTCLGSLNEPFPKKLIESNSENHRAIVQDSLASLHCRWNLIKNLYWTIENIKSVISKIYYASLGYYLKSQFFEGEHI